jgi:hypothetical protein
VRRSIFLLLLLFCLCEISVRAQAQSVSPKFLTLPFTDPSIKMQQGWVYSTGEIHSPAGAFDYIKGNLDDSSTWEIFDVVAAADGMAMRSSGGGYGNLVLRRHWQQDGQGMNYFTLYAHLADGNINTELPFFSRFSTNYSEWKPVRRGDFLGKAGRTGKQACNKPEQCIHLHFEVRLGAYRGTPLDPYDISQAGGNKYKRDRYPGGLNFSGCGPAYLPTHQFHKLNQNESFKSRNQ